MPTLELDIKPHELHYFDKFLNKEIMEPPVNSLKAGGSYDYNTKTYNRTYKVTIIKDEKTIVFKIELSAISEKIKPLKISIESKPSEHRFSEIEVEKLLKLLISRVKEAEKKTKEKPVKTFEYEARLLTSVYLLKSTIEFGKYKLVPVENPTKAGWECKLKFSVEAIDKDYSLTNATIEAKIVTAWLSLILNIYIHLKSFVEITPDPEPTIHFETVERPDLRPVKHPFGGEIKIPHDFIQLWNKFYSLPPKTRESFISSCLCYQLAMEMRMTHIPLSYQLFVTAIEVIAREAIGSEAKPTKRFIEFICQILNRSEKEFRKRVRLFYSRRSAILHEKGIGLGYIPSFDIRSFQAVPMRELWDLEIIVNATLIGFLKTYKKF